MKYKFCYGTHNKGSCQAYGKVCNNCKGMSLLLNVVVKRKAHSLNQEYSDNTVQDGSLSDSEVFFIDTINVQNSNPSNIIDVNFENTNNRNSFTERVSDNSNNQVFDDNLQVIDQKNISIKNNKYNCDNLQNTQNLNNVSMSLMKN